MNMDIRIVPPPKDRKPEAFVMVGLPGSGKTTWIQDNLGQYDIACSDDFVKERAQKEGITYAEALKKHHKTTSAMMKERVAALIAARKPFIWDQVNLFRKERQAIYKLLSPTHKVVFVCFLVPFDICMKRNLERGNKTGQLISENRMKLLARKATFPNKEEPCDRIIHVTHPDWKVRPQ